MNIIVPNYEILNFEAESLVVSDIGMSKVYSKPLLKILRELKMFKEITKVELEELFVENGLDESSALEFIGKIIPFRRVEEVYFEKTIILHDWEGRADFEGLMKSELCANLEFRTFSENITESVHGYRCFIVLVCYSYNYDSLKKLYFDLARASSKSAIVVCWRMGGLYCIGQPYIAEVGSPCHFCSVDRLINNEAVMPAKNKWACVLAFCKNKHVGVPSKSLSLYQEMLVIGAIARKVKFFTEYGSGRRYQDDILHGSYLKLSDGEIFEECNSHWYMCECLGRDR